MDDLAQYEEDLAAYRAQRLRLRDLANRILEEMESLPAPQTFLEAERASKAIIARASCVKVDTTLTKTMRRQQSIRSV